jgi:hypothetical protein
MQQYLLCAAKHARAVWPRARNLARSLISERVEQQTHKPGFVLGLQGGGLRIAQREAILDAHELGSLGAVSFIL